MADQGDVRAVLEYVPRFRGKIFVVLIEAGLLPDFPFGTDFTEDELHIVRALKKLKHATQHPVELVSLAVDVIGRDTEASGDLGAGLGDRLIGERVGEEVEHPIERLDRVGVGNVDDADGEGMSVGT